MCYLFLKKEVRQFEREKTSVTQKKSKKIHKNLSLKFTHFSLPRQHRVRGERGDIHRCHTVLPRGTLSVLKMRYIQ